MLAILPVEAIQAVDKQKKHRTYALTEWQDCIVRELPVCKQSAGHARDIKTLYSPVQQGALHLISDFRAQIRELRTALRNSGRVEPR